MSDDRKDAATAAPEQPPSSPARCAGHCGGCRRRGAKALLALVVVGVAGFLAWSAWAHDRHDLREATLRDPARAHAQAERLADRALGRFDMPLAHRDAARQTIVVAADELQPLLAAHYDARVSLIEALSADRVDPAQLESLRAAAIQRADAASRTLVRTLATLGEQLTPEQRRQLLAQWKDHRG